ncbi:MAG TPA: hypothetical protein VF131_10760 [Blastocatellia bacterium]|nr:hypothetical protein [Blastocatellia bacterium]
MASPTKSDEPIYRFDDVIVDRENFRVQKGNQTRTLAPRAEVQITSDGGQNFEPAFSPDGSLLAYYSKMRGGIWNVYSVSRSTRQQKQLMSFTKLNSYVRYPAWSPLNDRIAYEYAETTGNIWMIELK